MFNLSTKDLWLPTCRKWYAQLCTSNPKTIRGQIFGHKHSDQFNFVGVDGVVNGPNLTPANSIAVQCAPSIVPSFNPSYRIWKVFLLHFFVAIDLSFPPFLQYDPASFDLSDYDQFYADLDSVSPLSFFSPYLVVDSFIFIALCWRVQICEGIFSAEWLRYFWKPVKHGVLDSFECNAQGEPDAVFAIS